MKLNYQDCENFVWDWNGTLFNDIELCVAIGNELSGKFRAEKVTVEEYRKVFGFPVIDYWKRLGVDFDQVSFDDLTRDFMRNYTERVFDYHLHNGVEDVLQALRKDGKGVFILTAAHIDDVTFLLSKYKLSHYFDDVFGLENHRAESKVDKGLMLMKKHEIDPEKTVMMGDTIHDYEVAKAMGIYSILIPNGHQSKERLVAVNDNRKIVLDDISEVIGF